MNKEIQNRMSFLEKGDVKHIISLAHISYTVFYRMIKRSSTTEMTPGELMAYSEFMRLTTFRKKELEEFRQQLWIS